MPQTLPEAAPAPSPQFDAEPVLRLAAVRHALRLVDTLGDGPDPDPTADQIAERWTSADETRRRAFDKRSEQLVCAAASGLDALLAERQSGREPHAAANQLLVDQIRAELAQVARVILD